MSKVAWYGLGLLTASGASWLTGMPSSGPHVLIGAIILGLALLRGDR